VIGIVETDAEYLGWPRDRGEKPDSGGVDVRLLAGQSPDVGCQTVPLRDQPDHARWKAGKVPCQCNDATGHHDPEALNPIMSETGDFQRNTPF
jgi:hypothetical protein